MSQLFVASQMVFSDYSLMPRKCHQRAAFNKNFNRIDSVCFATTNDNIKNDDEFTQAFSTPEVFYIKLIYLHLLYIGGGKLHV